MKLGIFGDSFACGSDLTKHFHWYNLLGEKLHAEVNTHGIGASSTFFSYKMFLDENSNYDLNIFLVSHFSRYPKPLRFLHQKDDVWFPGVNSVDSFEDIQNLNSMEKLTLNHLRGWFIISDDEFLSVTQDLLVEKILSIRPDTLIIPCFDKGSSIGKKLESKLGIHSNGNCATFCLTGQSSLGIAQGLQVVEKEDKIACHFTQEVSEIFAECVYNKIKYDRPIICPTFIQHQHPPTFYYNIKS